MENEIWHLTDDLCTLPARDALRNILSDDWKNYERAESELAQDMRLLDDAIVLFMEALQAAYGLIHKWRGNSCNRASLAMLGSSLNYILLARHGTLLGYYAEVRDLLRSCYERFSRCYLFWHSKESADDFFAGKEIRQAAVDKELSRLENEPGKQKELLMSLRQYYSFLSEVAHPNLRSFEARHGQGGLAERVGTEYLLGGVMSSELGHVVLTRILQTVLSALRILAVILPEQSGSWAQEYMRIRESCDAIIGNLQTT